MKAVSIRFLCSDDISEKRNDRPTKTKQSAVKGEICPNGAPLIDPSILKPRCSIASRIPKEERKKKRRAINVPIELIIIPTLLDQRPLGNCVQSKIAIPNNMNKNAVLGAIGIRPELKLVNTELPKIHPIKVIVPMPSAK